MSKVTFPRKIRIITTRGMVGHNFEKGSIVTLVSGDQYSSFYARGYCLDRGYEDEQIIRQEDFTEIEAPLEAVSPTQKKAEKLVAKRVKMIYTVQDSDGDIIFFTQDRDMAREVKAEEGGKANGVIIMQYGELKEIR